MEKKVLRPIEKFSKACQNCNNGKKTYWILGKMCFEFKNYNKLKNI